MRQDHKLSCSLMVGRWFATTIQQLTIPIAPTYEKDTRTTLILAYWIMYLYSGHIILVNGFKRGLETILDYT